MSWSRASVCIIQVWMRVIWMRVSLSDLLRYRLNIDVDVSGSYVDVNDWRANQPVSSTDLCT